MDDEELIRASHMMRVQDEAQHGMLSNVDLAVRSVTMFRQQTEPTTPPQESGTSITVAIDLGTSNTAVAFSKDGEGSRPIITEIKNYPEDPINRAGIMSSQVPTETLYSKDSKTDGPYFKVETHLTARETDVTAIESNLTDTSFDTMTDYSGNLSDITSNSEDDQELERIYDQSMAEGDDVQSEPGSCYDQSMAEARMEPTDSAEEDMEALCWGHGVRSKLGADLPRSDYNHVAQSKLLLDKVDTSRLKRQARIARNIHRIQETTRRRCNLDPQNNMKTRSGLLIQAAKIPQSNPPSRHRGKDAEYDVLREVVRRLIERKLIRNKLDVIVHFLTQLLRHVKRELADVHNISCPLQIKYVLSVPVTWTSTALLAMQNALRIAIDTSGLGTMDDLFLVSEPEAATNYLIQKNGDLKPGDKFLTLDCGGGTIDATAYQAEKEYPLRLSKELVEPGGCTHGSSLLNRDFRKLLKRRIEGQREKIETRQYTLEGILDEHVLEFEDRLKRRANIYSLKARLEILKIKGLEADPGKRLREGIVELNQNDFKRIFMPHLNGIGKLLRRQLTGARENGHEVTKVLLTGGFSASKSLQIYLEREIKKISREFGYKIQLICGLIDTEHETAVVRGALIRANDKSDGPDRISQLSYGVEIMEEHNPERFSAHERVKPTVDKIDGRYYVNSTISWLIIKGTEVLSGTRYQIPVYRIFDAEDTTFVCTETLYVSDTSEQSHYRRTHENNRGARVAGQVTADMAYLVTEGLIDPIEPDGIDARRHYKIEFDLIMIVNGRNLRFEARWQRDGRSGGGHKDISIAAAFTPGTM